MIKKNKNGYKEDSINKYNKHNHINANKITMKNVKKNLIAVKLDKKGKPVGIEFMQPGKDYDFDDAYSVLEMPQYQVGGTQTGPQQVDPNSNQYQQLFPYTDGAVAPQPQQFGPQQINQDSTSLATQKYEPMMMTDYTAPTDEELDQMDFDTDFENIQNFNTNFSGPQAPSPQGSIQEAVAEDKIISSNAELAPFEQDEFPNIQFFNPYGGVDLPTAATVLGQSIQNKDTLGTVASSVKLAAGLGRNVVGGMGQANRTNETMKEYYRKLREDGNVTALKKGGQLDMYKKGGMKDEEFLTGEYITGMDEYDKMFQMANAKIENGEYYATAEGDIAEVVGESHNGKNGGESVIMDKGDRILTDHTKLGASNAKYIRDNYDLKVKAKNTYADVLDRFKTKSGFGKLIKEEEDIHKKLEEQEKVNHSGTKDLNTKFLQDKLKEITDKKSPMEEARKGLYNELFELQEKDKPVSERADFQDGGDLPQYQSGGEGAAKVDVREGQSLTAEGFFGNVNSEEYKKFVAANRHWFDFTNFDPTKRGDVTKLQDAYNAQTDGNRVRVDGKFGEQTASMVMSLDASPWAGPEKLGVSDALPEAGQIQTKPKTIEEQVLEIDETYDNEEDKRKALNALLLPDQYPMVPQGTQPVLKTTRRYDRVAPAQIDVEPYLQQLYDQQGVAQRQTEGLTPNIQAAASANIGANTQKAITDAMLRIDAANIGEKSKAEIMNARIQGREEDARVKDLLSYENRALMSKSKTDYEIQQFFDKNQQVNLGNFNTINDINLANARYDNIQFDGQGFIVRDKPDFSKTLDAAQLFRMNKMLEEYESENKSKK